MCVREKTYLAIAVDTDERTTQQHLQLLAEWLTLHHFRPLLLGMVDGRLWRVQIPLTSCIQTDPQSAHTYHWLVVQPRSVHQFSTTCWLLLASTHPVVDTVALESGGRRSRSNMAV